MTFMDNVETGELLNFGEIQRCVEQGEWITPNPVWGELLKVKEYGRKKLEICIVRGPDHK